MTEFNPVGQHVTVGRITGQIGIVVRKGDRYLTDIRNDKRTPPHPALYAGESFAVVVDILNHSHHVWLSEI